MSGEGNRKRAASDGWQDTMDEITVEPPATPDITLRQRRKMIRTHSDHHAGDDFDFEFLELPDNEVEEHKMTQNYMVCIHEYAIPYSFNSVQ